MCSDCLYTVVLMTKFVKIPINTPILGKEELSAVVSVVKSGGLTSASKDGGKNVQEFEKLVRTFVKTKYAVSVNSGTAALQAALYALDIKKGDEVIVPSFTFVASANAIASTGAKPVFVDILKENFTIDPDSITKKITRKTKAIMPVHLYGHISSLDRIREISKKHNLSVVEDAAQSLGSTFKGKQTGTFFELGCYSLYPGKVITSGEGGVIVTNNKKLYEKLQMIRNHGMVKGYDSKIFGLNLRLPEINAAIAKIQIKKLPEFIQSRRRNAKLLSDLLSDTKIKIPFERKHEKFNWSLYTIATKNRDSILKKLNSKGIGAAVYYPIPVHKIPIYKNKSKLTNTDWASKHVLSLPVHPNVSSKNIEYIAKTVRDLVNE
ncbi:DegT/DnrJ/EryC1/StrS family aminotransferase [Candidatus Nitrosopumilus sp. SW]|uniref:DegT/DnrJ/EryC1/StrS family aminotransferase n=1 Tax=Candidatus Nitrosopumilus sp. SW TaxID=2508726 RepID=UPI00114E090D|nr:DegT/DnrJ/EryC1/StrS family aminotransferase [Candidatus Nitrosopumilus sp. SW]QDI88979.1 DegT/DnrJ/EryC1/StrS family aminotransferase [Candidatus Nitrosopumilus sp. SW]